MKKTSMIGAAALCSMAGLAQAQPTIDGKLGAGEASLYGSPLWVQTNPTQFGDAGPGATCDPNATGGNPAAVTKGTEVAIPWATLGVAPGSTVRLMAFINGSGHDYASNQFLGGLALGSANLGGDGAGGYVGGFPAALRFDLSQIVGDQFFVVGGQAPNPCPTDLDNDGQTGGSDLGILLGAWGPCAGACPTDLDGDQQTGGSDLGILLGAWGLCP